MTSKSKHSPSSVEVTLAVVDSTRTVNVPLPKSGVVDLEQLVATTALEAQHDMLLPLVGSDTPSSMSIVVTPSAGSARNAVLACSAPQATVLLNVNGSISRMLKK